MGRDIFVSMFDKKYGKKFVDLCENLQLKKNLEVEDFLKAEFTNFHEPDLYFCKIINDDKDYPISFSVTVSKKTLQIKEFALLDECALQPCICKKEYFEEITKIIDNLPIFEK